MLVLMAGLPGTGKTTVARELARRVSGIVLSKDEIRFALFAPNDIEYSAAQDDFVMEIMLQAAGYLLHKDAARVVILDGRTFSQSSQIRRVLEFASTLRQPWRILECVCAERSARARLERQHTEGAHVAANRDFALYEAVKARFQAISVPKIVLDTDLPLEACLQRALEGLS